MTFMKKSKRIIAGIIAATMILLSIDGGAITALAEDVKKWNTIQENVMNLPIGGLLQVEGHEGVWDEVNHRENSVFMSDGIESLNETTFDWTGYSTSLIYNQLPSAWKVIWDDMDEVCMSYLTTNIDGVASTNPFDGNEYYFTKTITIDQNITSQEFGTLYTYFMQSNPQYYFLGYSGYEYVYGYDGDNYIDGVGLGMYQAFLDGDVRLELTKDLELEIEKAYEGLDEAASEEVKLRYLHDYIVNKVEYNYDVLTDGALTNDEEAQVFTQSLFSAFILDKTVCAGYAEALQLLCNGVGLESISITSIDHMWNKVRVNDTWYNVDPTWADNGKTAGENNPVYYGYYGRSDAFYANDTNEMASSHIPEYFWNAYMPVCMRDTNPTSANQPGRFYVPSKTLPAPVIDFELNDEQKYEVSISMDKSNIEYSNAVIYYTLDGSDPSEAATKSYIYDDAFIVEADTVVRAIAVLEDYYDSSISNEQIGLYIKDQAIKNHFYQKLTFVWKALGEMVDGYSIQVYNEANHSPIGNVIDISNGNTSFYLYDTSALTADTSVYFKIYGYVIGENNRKIPVTPVVNTASSKVNQLALPLDVEVKWHVQNNEGANVLVVNVYEETQDKLGLWYFTDKNGINSLNNFTLDMTDGITEFKYSFDKHGVPYNEVGYVLITNEDKTTAFQENGFAVGGTYKKPVLMPIPDVQLESTNQVVKLTAQITDASMMKNFNYKYQWYISDDATSQGTAIPGATSAEYEVQIGSFDEKFFYCEVTAEYITKNVVVSQNADGLNGKHTSVRGALYNTNITHNEIPVQIYDGTAKTPELILKNELDQTLVLGTDYTLQFIDNINAGEATIKVKFIGNYDWMKEATIQFEIKPKTASKETMEFSDVVTGKEYVYNGLEHIPEMVVRDPQRKEILVPNGDYDIAYKGNVDAGTATITLKFKGNYEGRVVIDFEILPKSAENTIISPIADQVFTSQPIIPTLTIKDGDKLLEYKKDYLVTCTKNIHVAVADVSVEFIGNYEGRKTAQFNIVPRDASEVTIEDVLDQEYTGLRIEPSLEVVYRYGDFETVLTKGTNYTVSFTNNIALGEAIATLTFDGDFTGTKETRFKIVPRDANNLTYEEIASVEYDGNEKKPLVVIKNGSILLEEGKDYVVEYSNNVNAGKAKATVEFTGFEGCFGNYKGSYELSFEITPRAATNCTFLLETLSDYTFNGQEFKPGVMVSDGTVVLVEDTQEIRGDYKLTYLNNINAGKATVVIDFVNNYSGQTSLEFEIQKKPMTEADFEIESISPQTYIGKEIIPSDLVVKEVSSGVVLRLDEDYTLSAGAENIFVGSGVGVVYANIMLEGNYVYTGEPIKATFDIIPRDSENVTISTILDYVYTGNEIKPSLDVRDGDIILVEGRDYTVEYQDNIEVGTATVIITFKENFIGDSKSTTFTILEPVPTQITSSVFYVSQTNRLISKITTGTKTQTLLSNLNEKKYVTIFDKNGAVVSGDKILLTGMIAGIVDDGKITERYTVVVTGDVVADGMINISDMMAVKSYILGKSSLATANLKAADVNATPDGSINIVDFMRIKAHILKKDTITGVAVN